MKHIAIILAMLCTASHADEWTGKDKAQHAIAGALVGAAFTIATESPKWGCVAATAIGAAKEGYDAMHKEAHTASFKDFAVTAIAGCAVSGITGLVIQPNRVSYTISLNLL
jgi:uncharacterized protein YfiM (DUF2279 family)